jgi:hypothetical protein
MEHNTKINLVVFHQRKGTAVINRLRGQNRVTFVPEIMKGKILTLFIQLIITQKKDIILIQFRMIDFDKQVYCLAIIS